MEIEYEKYRGYEDLLYFIRSLKIGDSENLAKAYFRQILEDRLTRREAERQLMEMALTIHLAKAL